MLNETPKARSKKTKSARSTNPLFWRVLPVVVAGLILFGVGVFVWGNRPGTAELKLGQQTITLEVADTDASRAQGLSGQPSLPPDSGMLFVYEDEEPYRCFWMKDMQFALDIIWLDANRRVVHLEQNIHPSTYPETFCNTIPAQYVLELNANQFQSPYLLKF